MNWLILTVQSRRRPSHPTQTQQNKCNQQFERHGSPIERMNNWRLFYPRCTRIPLDQKTLLLRLRYNVRTGGRRIYINPILNELPHPVWYALGDHHHHPRQSKDKLPVSSNEATKVPWLSLNLPWLAMIMTTYKRRERSLPLVPVEMRGRKPINSGQLHSCWLLSTAILIRIMRKRDVKLQGRVSGEKWMVLVFIRG